MVEASDVVIQVRPWLKGQTGSGKCSEHHSLLVAFLVVVEASDVVIQVSLQCRRT
jgi:hypothetical protein